MSGRLMLTGLATGLVTGLSVFAFNALAQQPADGSGYHPHMWSHGSWGGSSGFFHGPLMVVFTIVVLVLVVMAVSRLMGCGRHRCGRRGHGGGSSSAMAILEERFAKGEIDKAEFEERKNTLNS